ncbi:hypothetical protein B0O99DRAFT_628600 [Bisporella sp. PMI_857]|nr:hypothetical protein B0O99DRAFT_628600 [Bisporella sp. PMI_857]
MLSPLLLFAPALALATPLKRAATPQITILGAETSGTGCPQGTVSSSFSPDGTVVTFGFDAFVAYIGPNAKQSEKSKACQIHLNLKYPGGFQFAVVEAVYHGYARLDAGVTGTFLSTYYFSQDASRSTTTRSSITGKDWLSGNVYTKEDQVPTTATIWSPCGDTGLLNINNRIALTSTSSSASGELSDDDATVRFTQQLHVSWKPCTPGGGTGGGDFGTGGSGESTIIPRDADAEADPQFEIGEPGTIVTPGGGSAPSPGDVWTIGPPSTIITHPRQE